MAELKKDPAHYERAVMILAIQNYESVKKSEKLKAAIKSERLKNRVKRTPLLENKVRGIFSEIKVYRREGASFVEITKILKKHHRAMFGKFILTPSYLRRIILKIESENATAK